MASMFSSLFKSGGVGGASSGSGNFEVGKEVSLPQPEKHLFRLHEGILKTNNPALAHLSSSNEISVFVCDNPAHLSSFSAAVKRLKTLRHPSIVTYLDSVETDGKVLLATEKVSPLSVHLDDLDGNGVRGEPRDNYIAWGIFQVMRGLAFLNVDAKLRHNSLFGDAIFVTRAGDWKIFALDKVTSIQSDLSADLPSASLPALQKYDPPEVMDHAKRKSSTPWSRDMWGVGCIIWEIFNGALPAAKNLGQMGSIPKKLAPMYMELVAANPAKRPNPKEKVQVLRRGSGYFKNDLIDTILFLEELHIKEDGDKSRFYSSLGPLVDNFPIHVGSYKILPELIKAFEYGNAGAAILNPVFKLGANLDSEEYVKVIVPCLVKLFASNDRNARYKLLSQIENFVCHLSDKLVNDQVFPHIQNGFVDQEPMIREKSVIAMIHLAPKLTYSNLDENVVMKHFARLLRDEQASIRTNTTVCLGKISRYLHYQTRQKVLISAFTGKLRDPFPPARIAAINALAATQQFFTIQETSHRVLPALCLTLTDVEEPVRGQGFKVTQGFIAKLEQVSKNPALKEEMEADVQSTNAKQTSSSVAGWATWAVGALSAKFYKSAPKPQQDLNAVKRSEGAKVQDAQKGPERAENTPYQSRERQEQLERMTADVEELVIDEKLSEGNANDGWDDAEDWGSLENDENTSSIQDNTDDFGSWSMNTKKSAAMDNDWSSWGDPVPVGSGTKGEDKAQREERRNLRRAEMAAKREARKGGPMKLGAKKS